MFDTEQVLTASWSPARGVDLVTIDLSTVWSAALRRLGHDLHVRQFNGSIAHIDWVAEYEPDSGVVWLYSNVTPEGGGPGGLGVSGSGAHVDSAEDEIAVNFADLVQDQIARTGIAWPWGAAGGFLRASLIDGVAMWTGREDRAVVGTLEPANHQ